MVERLSLTIQIFNTSTLGDASASDLLTGLILASELPTRAVALDAAGWSPAAFGDVTDVSAPSGAAYFEPRTLLTCFGYSAPEASETGTVIGSAEIMNSDGVIDYVGTSSRMKAQAAIVARAEVYAAAYVQVTGILDGAAAVSAQALVAAAVRAILNVSADVSASAAVAASCAAVLQAGASTQAQAVVAAAVASTLVAAAAASGSATVAASASLTSAARSWTTGRDYFSSAFATDEWLIGNTTYSSGYAPNVGTETLVDNGAGGLTGQTSTNVVTGGVACGAWDSVDTGDRLESDGTTAGDFNALTTDFAFRMVFEVIGGSLPNSEYLLTKFNTSTGGWRIYSSGGEWFFGLWDNSGNTAGVFAANPASGSYADGDTHYMTGWVDASTGTIYTKGDLSAEASASIAADIVDSTITTAALHVNGYASTTGLAGLKCISVSVCVGANAQNLYDETFWNHPP